MGVGAGLYIYDVVVKNSRSLSHLDLLMSSCLCIVTPHGTDLPWYMVYQIMVQILLEATLCNNLRQVVYTYVPVTKQYNLVPVKGR